MLRRAAAIATGLAMATSFGIAGAGMASAAVPTLKVHNGATWTIEVNGNGCQLDVFHSNYRFFSPEPQYHGDAGTWSGGGKTIKMKWTAGDNVGPEVPGHLHLDAGQGVRGYLRWHRGGRHRSAGQGSRAWLLSLQRSRG